MALTGIKTKPLLKGTLVSSGPWQALFGRQGQRIYPYQLGCGVRSTTTGTTVVTHGLGEFVQNDYFMVCTRTYFGDSYLFIPNTSKIGRVSSDPSAAVDDLLTVASALSVEEGDWLLNLGADLAAAPTTQPNYDGSLLTLYTDNAGNNADGNKYLLTAQNGDFFGWTDVGYELVDLLITNPSGVPQAVVPLHEVGPEII